MPSTWVGRVKCKLEKSDNVLASVNTLGPKPYTEPSGGSKDITARRKKAD
jgi:hypothetical protein